MLDSACDRDVISEGLAKELGLEMRSEMITVNTVESRTTLPRHLADFRLESLDESYVVRVDGALVNNLVSSINDIPPAKRDLSTLSHGEGVEFVDIDASIGVIISVSHAEAWSDVEVRKGGKKEPLLVKTAFGWTMMGAFGSSASSSIACNFTSVEDARLQNSLDRIFYHDFAVVSEDEIGESLDNKEAVAQLQESIHFNDEKGKYVVGLPWKGGRSHAAAKLRNVDSVDG